MPLDSHRRHFCRTRSRRIRVALRLLFVAARGGGRCVSLLEPIARSSAAAGAAIGEIVGLAKECSTFVVAKTGDVPSSTFGTCAIDGGVTYSKSWGTNVNNLRCLALTSASGSSVAVGIDAQGQMTCTIS